LGVRLCRMHQHPAEPFLILAQHMTDCRNAVKEKTEWSEK
jgi:hypothetical protein